MVKNIFLKIGLISACFYINTISLLYSSDSHFIHYEDLNCTYLQGESVLFKSGLRGNIYVWDPSFIDQDNFEMAMKSREDMADVTADSTGKTKKNPKKSPTVKLAENFDINHVHHQLHEKEKEIKKGWGQRATDNVVMAAITLVFRKNDRYYAITETLSKLIDTKAQGREKKPLAFMSGTTGRESEELYIDASTYSLSYLLKNSEKRFNQLIFSEDSELRRVFALIQKHQATKKKAAIELLERSVDLYEMEESLKRFDAYNNPSDSTLRKAGGYGPVADSEQFLLHYLEQELIQVDSALGGTINGIYINIIDDFIKGQYTYLKSNYSITDYKNEGIETRFQKGNALSKKISEYEILGSFLHLFSSRELCKFCATSLLDEFYHEQNNFAERLRVDLLKRQTTTRDGGSVTPFFVVLASYRDLVDEAKHPLRVEGTISGNLSRQPKDDEITYNLINLNSIIKGKNLPLFSHESKKIPKSSTEPSAAAAAPSK